MKLVTKSIIGVLCFISVTISFGQDRWSAAFRPGLNFPTQQLNNTTIKIGFGFEAIVTYHFIPRLGIYTGWSWNQFQSDEPFGESNVSFEETGYSFGFQFIQPIQESKFSYVTKIGVIYNHIKIENHIDDSIVDSKYGLGWQIDVGVDYWLVDAWSLRPTLRYRSLKADFELETITLNYISFGVSLLRKF